MGQLLAKPSSDKYNTLKFVNVASYFVSEFLSLNLGRYLGTEDIAIMSQKYDIAIQPENYAFGIWGLIYFGLMLFAIY